MKFKKTSWWMQNVKIQEHNDDSNNQSWQLKALSELQRKNENLKSTLKCKRGSTFMAFEPWLFILCCNFWNFGSWQLVHIVPT
jgi:hypothetical protein